MAATDRTCIPIWNLRRLPPSLRHSPTPGREQPFSPIHEAFLVRYLHHNRKQMETLHNTSTTGNTMNIRTRVRSGLILLGIVTSIICSLVLLKDIHLSDLTEVSTPTSMEASRIIPADLTGEVMNISLVSAIRALQ